jgi:hypothetical protein
MSLSELVLVAVVQNDGLTVNFIYFQLPSNRFLIFKIAALLLNDDISTQILVLVKFSLFTIVVM